MSMYMWLVVVALLARTAEAIKCKFPDEYELDMKQINKEIILRISNKNACGLDSINNITYNQNHIIVRDERTVKDFNMMIQFVIPEKPRDPCISSKLHDVAIRGIPDSAVKVDTFPIPLPDGLPEGIEYWRFKWEHQLESIVGVLHIAPSVCAYVVWGHYDHHEELITDSVLTIEGNYSLSIWHDIVFKVPAECLENSPVVPGKHTV